jgi:translation initiation factor IF-1
MGKVIDVLKSIVSGYEKAEDVVVQALPNQQFRLDINELQIRLAAVEAKIAKLEDKE